MTPDRTSAQVVDLVSERPRLIEARRQRIQKTVDEIIRELRLKNRYRALYRSLDPLGSHRTLAGGFGTDHL